MSRLLDHLVGLATAKEQEAAKLRSDAAVAIAYIRPEQENQAIVETAIAGLKPDGPAKPVLEQSFVAALAALPPEARSLAMNQLQTALNASRGLFARAGWSTLKKRIAEATTTVERARAGARNAEGMEDGNVVDPLDPMAIAKLLAAHYEVSGICTLRRWKKRWFVWRNAVYEETDDEIVDGMAYEFLATLQMATATGPEPLSPNKKQIEYVLHALAPLVQIAGSSPTRWLDSESCTRPPIERCVFCSNGTLAVDAWLEGRPDAFIPPTPALFVLRTLAMPFDPAAQAPRFERFVSDIFEGDADRIVALRLLFGYWLLADTSLQVVVIFCGMPQTGKGSLLTIIQGVLGIACCNPSFEQLGGPFGLEDLVGANLGILSDVHDVGPNAKSAVEKVLKISGEDSVDVPRKHKPALNSLLLTVRFILAMNELVSLPDVSGALSRRLAILPFNCSFIGKGQAGLAKSIIAEEGSGVLRWALDGLRLLQHIIREAAAEGKPTQSTVLALLRTKGSEDQHEMLADLGNPVRVFVREKCCIGADYTVEVDQLYSYWDDWAKNNGHQMRGKMRFTADLVSACKGTVSCAQRQNADGNRPRILKGITIPQILRVAAIEAATARSAPASEAQP